jgi:hypothetical protein
MKLVRMINNANVWRRQFEALTIAHFFWNACFHGKQLANMVSYLKMLWESWSLGGR